MARRHRGDRKGRTIEILTLVLIGALAGMMAGLFGIGGGAVIVPVPALLFEHRGVNPEVIMQCAMPGNLLKKGLINTIAHRRDAEARRKT